MEVEFGSNGPIGFCKVKMYNEDDTEMFCKCGKSVETVVIGQKCYVARCNSCMNQSLTND